MNHNDELYNILDGENVTTLFQAVVSMKTGDIIGYEALNRGPIGSLLHLPLDLMKAKRKENKQLELDMLFRKKAMEKAQKLKNNQLLFINVGPDIVSDNNFKGEFTRKLLSDYNLTPSSIIFEINEKTAIKDYHNFKSVLQYYNNQGYRVAIDDTSCEYSKIKTIKDTYPHFIKIDMNLIRNIDKDTFKQSMVNAFVNLSTSTNFKLIAEGIETKEELETLIRLGVYGGQGYFLQKPTEDFVEIPENIKNIILEYNDFLNSSFIHKSTYHYIGNIIEERKSFHISTPCATIKDYFEKNNKDGTCITNNGYPVGLIMRHNLDSSLAHKYGIALYLNRPISLIMDYSPLIVDFDTPINIVSEQAMTRLDKKTYDNIIVTKNSKYFGIVSVKKLLQYAISFERNYARQLNPLTQLPGNVIISRVLNDAISLDRTCCIFYFDLDNFKIYNDIYGFENGDKVIELIANIINKTIKTAFPYTSFVGHIGGDDFVSVLDCEVEDCSIICKEIISQFDENILDFLNENDKKNRYIISEDRNGNIKTYSLTSISIAGFYGNPSKFTTVDKFAQFMSIIKKDVKKISYSSYIIKDINNNVIATSIC